MVGQKGERKRKKNRKRKRKRNKNRRKKISISETYKNIWVFAFQADAKTYEFEVSKRYRCKLESSSGCSTLLNPSWGGMFGGRMLRGSMFSRVKYF